MNFILQYRILEIFQCLWISLSSLLFIEQIPETQSLVIWFVSLFLATGSAFWLNDYYDFKSDLSNPRKVRHHSEKKLKLLAFTSLILSLILSVLISFQFLMYIAFIGIASALYSSPWLHLKSRLFFPVYLHFLLGILFFRNIDALATFEDTQSSFLMSFFWALILAVGSLGNEMVDEVSDKKSRIDTIAVRYPGLSFYLILGAEVLSLIVLSFLSLTLNMNFSFWSIVLLGSIFILGAVLRKLSQNPEKFRGFYRVIFIMIILIFCLERIKMLAGRMVYE